MRTTSGIRIFEYRFSSGLFPIVALLSFGCATTSPGRSPAAATEKPADEASATEKAVETPPPKFEVTHRLEIQTSMGSMVVGLYGNEAPATVENFLRYVEQGFYSGKIFHRIIAGFMIQGGGYTEDMGHAEPESPIRLELVPGLKHEPGTISMARQPNNLHSATSQFFICTAPAPQLNGAYSAFGKLEQGEDVLYAISGVPTHSVETDYGKMDDVPVSPVVIETIRLLPPQEPKAEAE